MPKETITAERLATLEAYTAHMTKQQDIVLDKVSNIEKALGNLSCGIHEEKLYNIEENYRMVKKDMICLLRFKDRFTGKFAGAAAIVFILLQAIALYNGWSG